MKCTGIERKELEKYIGMYDFCDFLRNKTVLLTGAKGMVGTGIVKWILLQNALAGANTRVLASTREPEKIPGYIEPGDNISYVRYGAEPAVEEPIHYIIHAASPTSNQQHMTHPLETFRTNVYGMERLLDLARKNHGCCMIFLSSEEVYGSPSDDAPAMNEEMVAPIDSLDLRSCYPLGKKASEFMCYAAAKTEGMNVKIIRLSSIQGLFQRYDEPRVFNELLRCILENKNLVMKSDGLTRKCFMYSLDAIASIFTVLLKGETGNAYNAANLDTFYTVKDLANHLFQEFNPSIKVVFETDANGKSDGYLPHRTLILDCKKIEGLGWKPLTGLDDIYRIDMERFSENDKK